jgi:hypothetical protein
LTTKYELKKARMAADPEYAERIREEWRRANANRLANETPEEREKRKQRNREACAKRYQEWKAKQPPKEDKPKPTPKPAAINKPKPGRLMALAGWHRW